MAEPVPERKDRGSLSENLLCPLCLDVLEDPTLLSCAHTFCRKCLQRYDDCHLDQSHMVCPMCRKPTALAQGRVQALPVDPAILQAVREFVGALGGSDVVLEGHPKCTACKLHTDAVAFCYQCDNYMCEKCRSCHEYLSAVFVDHQIVELESMDKGELIINQQLKKCLVHNFEKKDLFCKDCSVQACLKCAVVDHRNHEIKNIDDFETEMQKKVLDFSIRCSEKQATCESSINFHEECRKEMHGSFQALVAKVQALCEEKVKRLKGSESLLLDRLHALQASIDREIDALKENEEQELKSMTSSMALVANQRLRHLEGDTLAAHSLLCSELDGVLKVPTDFDTVRKIKESASRIEIKSDDQLLDLGHVSVHWDLIRDVNVSHHVGGMAAKSDDTVIIAYNPGNINSLMKSIDLSGSIQDVGLLPHSCADICFQKDGTCVVSSCRMISTYASGSATRKSSMNVSAYDIIISSSPSGEVVAVEKSGSSILYIFEPCCTKQKVQIKAKSNFARQAVLTESGVVVTSSMNQVVAYDTDGQAGATLSAKEGARLYVTVNDEDMVIVASVSTSTQNLQFTVYELNGLTLVERFRFADQKLPNPVSIQSQWCYLVSLSRCRVAFAVGCHVYFIRLPFL